MLVRIFYVAAMFITIDRYTSWGFLLSRTTLELIWPIWWIDLTGIPVGVSVVLVLSVLGPMWAAVCPTYRPARLLAAIGLLMMGSLWNSFGQATHGWHHWISTAFLFVLLPDGVVDPSASSLTRREWYLRVFRFAQGYILFCYSLAGSVKVLAGVLQAGRGEVSLFHPDAMVYQVTARLFEGIHTSVPQVYNVLLSYPRLMWLSLLCVVFIELTAALVAFRPSLYRTWGTILILFHVASYLLMTIMFSWQCLILGLMLVCSPFSNSTPGRSMVGSVVRAFPVIGDASCWYRRWQARKVETLV